MKFLADENFPRQAVTALRDAGFDVSWITEIHPGLDDIQVLALSSKEGRSLLTFDKDFGELAYRDAKRTSSGVILFRITPESPDEIAQLALAAIRSQPSWEGYFSVVTGKSIRMRKLAPTLSIE